MVESWWRIIRQLWFTLDDGCGITWCVCFLIVMFYPIS